MSFTRLTKNVLNVSALPDRVQNQAQALKATFDQAGVDIKEALNGVMAELEGSTSASNIGAKDTELQASTVQAELDKLSEITDNKVEKVSGKQLSTEDYTSEEKSKLAAIEANANNYVLPKANIDTLGGIKPDGITIVVDAEGKARAAAAESADYEARERIDNLEVEKAAVYTYLATIPATGWTTTAPYYVDVAIEGILSTDYPHITPVYTGTLDTDKAIQEAWNKIDSIVANDGSIRVTAFEEVPTTEIPIQIEVVR